MTQKELYFLEKCVENSALVNFLRQQLSSYLDSEMLSLISISKIKTKAIYLAGCSTAVRELFIKRDHMDDNSFIKTED